MFRKIKRALIIKFLDGWLKQEINDMKVPQKTTILGILTIIGTAVHAATVLFAGGNIDWTTAIAGITAGWGLIHADDAKK